MRKGQIAAWFGVQEQKLGDFFSHVLVSLL